MSLAEHGSPDLEERNRRVPRVSHRPGTVAAVPSPTIDAEPSRVVRVLPDEPGINKVFDYLVPAALEGAELIQVGTMVRFSLHGRRMGGWIVAVDVSATAAGEKLRALTKVTGIGPPAELFALADWASWRWWGRPASFLRTASPERAVRGLANVSPLDPELVPVASVADELSDVAAKALADGGVTVLRSSPDTDPFAVIIEAVRHGGHGGEIGRASCRERV